MLSRGADHPNEADERQTVFRIMRSCADSIEREYDAELSEDSWFEDYRSFRLQRLPKDAIRLIVEMDAIEPVRHFLLSVSVGGNMEDRSRRFQVFSGSKAELVSYLRAEENCSAVLTAIQSESMRFG